MKIIKPSFKIENAPDYHWATIVIEKAGRTCYQSDPDDSEAFIRRIIKRGHESVLEHVSISVRIVCDRGVSHELVRHRLASYSQESTRYVRYDGDMEFVEPWWWDEKPESRVPYVLAFSCAEETYKKALQNGDSPQAARAVLPNSLKTEIVVSANLREWRHIFKLRCDKAAHPDMRRIMCAMLADFKETYTVFFEDIEG